ncbi:GlsB/YeaQ/YmgE family stress response membrane protein [soil metagenome]
MGILAWIILGGIAGWLASKVMNTDAEQGIIANVVVGIIGAMIGGFVWGALGGADAINFSLVGLLVATGGAVILLFFYKMIAGKR